jgi:hypothetical protein
VGHKRAPFVYLEVVVGDFTDESLERKLPDQEIGAVLVFTNLTQCDGSGAEPMRLLYATWFSLKKITRNTKQLTDEGDEVERRCKRTALRFLAPFAANCLRGALPVGNNWCK